MELTPSQRLVAATESYFSGKTSFWDLYDLAGDLVPIPIHTDREAAELAGATMAAEAEINLEDKAKEADERREMIREAMPRSVR
jgi:hypothetical protein